MMNNVSDTLVVDTARLVVWRQNDDYAYDSEIVPSQMGIGEWLRYQIDRFFYRLFGSDFYQAHESLIWLSVVIIAVFGILYFLWMRHPELFIRSRDAQPLEYEVTEDDIYGVDFAVEIDKAKGRMDYREVLRLVYLQTLRILSDNHLLEWQPYKTPTQYSLEVKNVNFRQMTHLFVRVRYGNFEATSLMAEQMLNHQKSLLGDVLQAEGGKS